MIRRRFEGKGAIVTGAAGGIGAAIVERLAAEGAGVLIADLDGAGAQARVEDVSARLGASVVARACDVGDEVQVIACFDAAAAAFGRVDVVVNNAGLMTFKRLDEWDAAEWERVLRVDLIGAALFVKHAFLRMDGGGAIVNVSSVHAARTTANVAPYAAAKAGLLSLTRSAAIEGKAKSIRANAVLPGAIDTPMLWGNPNVRSGLETIERDDVGTPGDVAGAVAFLASEDAAFVTGACLAVDGGRLAAL